MRKPEIEIVKFDSSDVIATSGKSYSLTVSNFKDGLRDNLIVNFNGYNHNSFASLNSALGSEGLTGNTDRPAALENDGKDLSTYFTYDSAVEGTEYQVYLNANVNGTYTWFDTENKWKHN